MKIETYKIYAPGQIHFNQLQLIDNQPTISEWWIYDHSGRLLAYKYSDHPAETYKLYDKKSHFEGHELYKRIKRESVPDLPQIFLPLNKE